ncbi:MAG: hypothetical protein IJH91_07010 [Mogibacterium sp.]|nr:hypothetical protein [Mogibacterium sp.]
MKKHLMRICGLLLAITMVLGPVAVFAADEEPLEVPEAAEPAEIPETVEAADAVEPVSEAAPVVTEATPVDVSEAAPSEVADEPSESPAELAAAPDELAAAPEEPAGTSEEPSEALDEPSEALDEPSEVTGAAGGQAKAAEPTVSSAAAREKLYSVGGTAFESDADQSDGWTDGSGWRYDAATETITLVNYNGAGQDILSDGTGVTIQAAGLNRIGTLSCDGTVNLIGTGILLVDEIELSAGSSFNLLPNEELYGADGGSVAVFLKESDGVYCMVNGGVTGILDETYYVPDGITLVVPGDTTLCVQAVVSVVSTIDPTGETTVQHVTTETDEIYAPHYLDEEKEIWVKVDFVHSSSKLDVANLVVEAGGTVMMQNASCGFMYYGTPSTMRCQAQLNIREVLENDGLIRGNRVDLGEGAELTGDGVFRDTELSMHDRSKESLNVVDSIIKVNENTEIGTLRVGGKTNMYYKYGGTVGSVVFRDSESELAVNGRGLGYCGVMTFCNPVTGGQVVLESGVFNLPEDRSGFTAERSDETGLLESYLSFVRTVPSENPSIHAIPVRLINSISYTLYPQGYEVSGFKNVIIEGAVDQHALDSFDGAVAGDDGTVVVKDVTYRLIADEYENQIEDSIGFEVIVMIIGADGKLDPVRLNEIYELSEGAEITVPADTVYEIIVVRDPRTEFLMEGVPGGNSSSTVHTSFTGTGVLGSNAGSIQGGNSTRVLSGSGLSRKGILDTEEEETPSDAEQAEEERPSDAEPTDPEDTQPEPADRRTAAPARARTAASLVPEVQVEFIEETEETGAYYVLTVLLGETVLEVLDGYDVIVEMAFELPEEWKAKPVYAVFRTTLPEGYAASSEDGPDLAENADEEITVIPAVYDEETGLLTFEAQETGAFVIVCFEYDGEVNTPEFFAAIKQLDDVRTLLALEKEQE